MPELPEVETTVNGIKPWLENKTINRINVYNNALRWKVPDHIPEKYLSQTITAVRRRAKYILIDLECKDTLMIHLGMSGSLVVLTEKQPLKKHDHFEMIMDDGTILRYNDPRRFGCILDAENIDQHKLIKNLGPEPLDQAFTGQLLKKLSSNKTQAVKNFIMDGRIVVGVGNIYASEALHMAGILPTRSAGKISLARYKKLTEAIKVVLSKAITAGGTTLKDFINAEGKPGYFSQKLQVYGRKDKPCFHCSSTIKQITVGQRSTFYCTSCQK